MFAHDLSHSQIDISASVPEILRLGEECYRLILKRQSEAIQQIFNLQSSIFNSSLSGLGFRKFDWKAQIREEENRLTDRFRNIQREMKEIVRTQPNV